MLLLGNLGERFCRYYWTRLLFFRNNVIFLNRFLHFRLQCSDYMKQPKSFGNHDPSEHARRVKGTSPSHHHLSLDIPHDLSPSLSSHLCSPQTHLHLTHIHSTWCPLRHRVTEPGKRRVPECGYQAHPLLHSVGCWVRGEVIQTLWYQFLSRCVRSPHHRRPL